MDGLLKLCCVTLCLVPFEQFACLFHYVRLNLRVSVLI